MTTTPAASWANATPLGHTDEDPWNADDVPGPCEPAKNMGGHRAGNEDHTALGDDEDISVFADNEEPEELETGDFWEKGYYSSPIMQKDR